MSWKGPRAASGYNRAIRVCVRKHTRLCRPFHSLVPCPAPEARENAICQEGKDFHYQFVRTQVSGSDGDSSRARTERQSRLLTRPYFSSLLKVSHIKLNSCRQISDTHTSTYQTERSLSLYAYANRLSVVHG